MRGGAVRGLSARAAPAFALVVCAVAAWQIGRTLVAGPVLPSSVAALLGEAGQAPGQVLGQARGPVPGTRPSLPAPDAAAVDRARALLRAEPLAAQAYAVLALAADDAGRDEQAARLMAVAAAWWPRDLLVRTWLLARALRRRDPTAAMAELDRAVRARPDALDDLTEALSPLLAEPAGREALAARLAEDPPWRSRYLQIALRQWRAPQGLVALLGRLQAEPRGLRPEELRPYLTKLLETGQVDEAYAAWLRSLPPEARADLPYLYNGDFRRPLAQMPFDWRTPMVAGTTAAVAEAGGRPVLSVGFLGTRVAAQPVIHELVLAPGDYRLSGQVRTDRLRAQNGIRWRLACLADPDHALAGSEAFIGTAGWRDFTLDFTIPEEGCPAQALGLEVHARTASERQASGVVSFSGLSIVPR